MTNFSTNIVVIRISDNINKFANINLGFHD